MKHSSGLISDWAAPVCFLAAAALLSAGYAPGATFAPANIGIIPLVVSTMLLVWWGFQWQGSRWLPALLLVLDVCAAAGGVLLGKTPAWLIAGAAVALAGWELAGQRQSISGVGYTGSRRSHFRLLAVVLVLGLGFAEAGLFLHVSLPFWGVFLAGLVILFSLYRFFQTINHPGSDAG